MIVSRHAVFRRQFCSAVVKPIVVSKRYRKHEWYTPPTPEFGSERFWLQRRIAKYSELMYKLQSPRQNSIVLYGRTFSTPYRYDGVPLIDSEDGIRTEKLRSLAAYFGEAAFISFTGESCTGFSMSVYATQSNASILYDFACAFGGYIRIESAAAGGRQMTLRWRIYGNHARRVARSLLTVPCAQQKLLEAAIDWPGPGEARQRKLAEVKNLRQQCRMTFNIDCIESLSGYLDKKMTLDVSTMCKKKLVLRVSSLRKSILDQLVVCFTSLGMDAGTVIPLHRSGTESGVKWMWYQTQTEHSFALLRAIQPYLIRKKAQVDLILSADPNRLCDIRPKLFSLNGNNKRFYRNDFYCSSLSRKINTLQCHIVHRGDSETRREKLKILIDEREIHKLRKGCIERRDAIRRQLDDGAVINPNRSKFSSRQRKLSLAD
eukprot:gene451-131_t